MHDTKRRRYGFSRPRMNCLSATEIVGGIVILLFVGLVIHTLAPSVYSMRQDMPSEAQNWRIKPDCIKDDIVCLIHKYSSKYGINTETALRIAGCESGLDQYARNPSSTASGVYQFTNTTWEYTGGGEVFDAEQNVERFMQFYSTNKHWWVCK